MEKDDDANVESKEWTRIEEDGRNSDQRGAPAMEEAVDAVAGMAPGTESRPDSGAGVPESPPISPREAMAPRTAADAALNIISTMMNEIRAASAVNNTDSLDCRPLLKLNRTHLEGNNVETLNKPEEVEEKCSNTKRSNNIGYCELNTFAAHSHKMNQEINVSTPLNLSFNKINSDLILHGKVTPAGNCEIGQSHASPGRSEVLTIKLRYQSESNAPNNDESKKREECVEKSTGETKQSVSNNEERGLNVTMTEARGHDLSWRELGKDSLDSVLACAAADASLYGNPLRRLREVLRRNALPLSEDVRPVLASELASGRYDFLWSNLGLLRSYQDSLLLAPSSSGLSDDAATQATKSAGNSAADFAEDYCNVDTWRSEGEELMEKTENTITGGSVYAIDQGLLKSSLIPQEIRGEALDGKASNNVAFLGNARTTIWYTDSDTHVVDNSLKGIRKRVRMFFKRLFNHGKENVNK